MVYIRIAPIIISIGDDQCIYFVLIKEIGIHTYTLGENDYCWFHSAIDEIFWIIPELVLYNRGYISASDETKSRKTLQIREGTKWLKEYQYSYDDIDISKNKIIALFS